jgi:hypothetical protein
MFHTLEYFEELGIQSVLNLKELRNVLQVHSVNHVAKLVRTRRALSSTNINRHQQLVSGQACRNTS